MKKSRQARAAGLSEIRSDVNKLDPGEDTLDKRRELLGQLDTVEDRIFGAALTEEAEAESTQPDAHGITPEERAFRDLESPGGAAACLPVRHGWEAAHRSCEGAAGTSWPERS